MTSNRPLSLTEQERSLLLSWLDSPALAETVARRARIVLGSADGSTVRALARRIGVSADTVCLWRRRFQTEGLDGLRSRAQPGRPRALAPRRERAVLAALQAAQDGGAPRSATAVARAAGVSRATIRRLREVLRPPLQATESETAPGARVATATLPAAGTIVGIFLDHPWRLMVRVPAPRGRAAPTPPRRSAQKQRPDPPVVEHGRGAMLIALEGFRPRVAATRPSADLTVFLRRLARALPSPLEVVAAPGRLHARAGGGGNGGGGDAGEWLPADAHRQFGVRRCRTRGAWLAAVAGWVADAPSAQDRALGTALGHLTDYLATWREGRGPFIWTGGWPGLRFAPERGM